MEFTWDLDSYGEIFIWKKGEFDYVLKEIKNFTKFIEKYEYYKKLAK